MQIDRRLFLRFDWVLLGLTILIPCLGLVVLYSAGFDPETKTFAMKWVPFSVAVRSLAFAKQLMFLCGGFFVMFLTMSIPTQVIYRYSYIAFGICVVSLILVLLIGTEAKGARRWLSLGFIRIQPSEPIKLCLIVAFARFLAKHPPPPGGHTIKTMGLPFAIFGFPMLLILNQPDLGTSLVVGAIGFGMLLFAGIRPKSLAIMAGSGILAVIPMWLFVLKPYQKRRVFALLNPDYDPQGAGYHIIQSKIAVGSGAAFGKGYLAGTQSQLEFLPEHTTDFIFSVLAEEWGFAGALTVLLVYFCFLYRILHVVGRSKEAFPALMAFGVGMLIFFHVVVNIGMVIGIFPVVGIPLPLFSYGGTAVFTMLTAIGLVLGVSLRRFAFLNK